MNALTRADRRWFAPGTARAAAMVRVAVAVALGLRLALRDWAELARLDGTFRTKGIVSWIGSMPPEWTLAAVQVIGVGAAIGAIAATRAPHRVSYGRPALLLAWIALLVLAGLRDAVHVKIMHNDVLMLLAFLPIVVSSGDPRLNSDGRTVRWGWPRRTALVVVGLVYFFTAYQKLRISGLDWVTSDNLRWVLVEGKVSGRAPTDAVAAMLISWPLVCKLLAGLTLLTELSAPMVLAFSRTRPWFLLAAVALHGGIWLMMGLDYWGWMLTVAALVLPWERVVEFFGSVGRSSLPSAAPSDG